MAAEAAEPETGTDATQPGGGHQVMATTTDVNDGVDGAAQAGAEA
jgi:hypothetical protein